MPASPPPSALRLFLEKRGGAAPWREWMEAALYDPAGGYYTAHIRTVGARGDFSTAATLSGYAGRVLAGWVSQQWREAGRKLPLIEAGPGDGSLHRNMGQALGFWGRAGVRSHLVERSPVLRPLQQQALRGRRVTWHEGMESALEACGGEALIFSNELADAFPAHLLQRGDGRWQEVWLCIAGNGGIVEELRPVPPGVTSSACRLPWEDGQRIEVLESWREWLRSWRPHWKRGAMLTIDYGGVPESVYFRRPGGSVRGYRHQQRLDGAALYPLMGRCDVTVDVNFTDLREWGEALGLTTVETVDFRTFARRFGDPGSDPVYAAGGAAEAFQCLVQRAG